MDQLAWFDQRDLQIHAQVVVCPGLNDGPALERTLNDLASFAAGPWPAVLSAAVVLVGLTRFRPAEDGLVPVDPACARRVIAQVEPMQQQFQAALGTRFAWLSDEWYLMAGLPLPPRDDYEDLPQQENGGQHPRLSRSSGCRHRGFAKSGVPAARCSWVVGRSLLRLCSPWPNG